MCVFSSGKIEPEIATRLVKSTLSSGAVTARIASLLVRTSSPRRSETFGSEPLCLQRCSSLFVPSGPAASTTFCAVIVRRSLRSQAPVRSVVTA